mgnify:CR=1 FL=1
MTDTVNMTFKDLNLPSEILQALEKVGYETPSPIQAESIFRAKHDHDLQTRARQHTGGHNNYTTRDLVKFKTGAWRRTENP